MKTFKTVTIKSILGDSKLIIEVPHQRSVEIYTTNLKATDFSSEDSTVRFRDYLKDLSHSFVCKNLGDIKSAYESTIGHQSYKRKSLIKHWAYEMLTGPQYLWVFGERKSKQD